MGFRDGVETMSVDGKRRRDCLPGLSDEQHAHVFYFAVYPNLLLSLHPDYMMTHTLWPKAHDRTAIVCEWHFHPAERARPGFRADDAIEFWDRTNREDWWIAERSQEGIGSRVYEPGPYSERETLLWAFDEVVRNEARR
jgi:Rieske 2Fe-2S family protein